MTAVDPEGRIRHPLDVFHSTFDPAGGFVPAGLIPMADGLGRVEYVTGAAAVGLRWFNVEDYGAVHDAASDSDADIAAATDDTSAVNATCAACMAAGGGWVVFPPGIYAIKGPLLNTSTYNSQIIIPQHAYAGGSTPPIAIGFMGLAPTAQSNNGTSGPWRPSLSGAILRSDWNGTITNFPAVVSAGAWNAIYPAASFNWIQVTTRDLEIRTPANSKLTAWNLAATAEWSPDGRVTASTAIDSASMVANTHTNAFGFMTPLRINVNPPNLTSGVFADGYYVGFLANEMVNAVDLSVQHNVIGLQLDGPQNHAAYFGRVFSGANQYDVAVTGGVFMASFAQLDIEDSASGTFASVVNLYDPSNYLRGDIAYHKQEYGGSFTTGAELTRNGGERVSLHRLFAAGTGDATYKFTDVVDVPAAIVNPTTNPTTGRRHYSDAVTGHWSARTPAGAVIDYETGGAPTTADYLVGTAQGALSAEIVVGATPGGDLGNTWASPTVDGLQGRALAATAPSDGQAVVWDAAGSTWKPGTVSTGTHYEPLTSGDNSAPELVFTADGRCVMVPVGD